MRHGRAAESAQADVVQFQRRVHSLPGRVRAIAIAADRPPERLREAGDTVRPTGVEVTRYSCPLTTPRRAPASATPA